MVMTRSKRVKRSNQKVIDNIIDPDILPPDEELLHDMVIINTL
jgi:hypothetical protein